MRRPLNLMKIRPLQYGRADPLSNTYGKVRAGNTRVHQGWDLLASPGTPVFAIADGELKGGRSASYGNWISLKFQYQERTLFAFYAHLQLAFQANSSVVEGSLIALTGRTGDGASTLPLAEAHLHFEIRILETIPKDLGLYGRLDPGQVLGYQVYSCR